MIKTILLDLDGTLYSEKKFAESGFRAVSTYIFKKYEINKNNVLSILLGDFKKGLRKKNFNVLLEKLGLKNESVEKLIKIYQNHYPEKVFLYPDALEFLEKNNKKFKLGLITNGHKISQLNKISALNIKKYFKTILVVEKFGNDDWEKSVDSFKILLKKIKAKPEESVYVGDNPKRDFMGAKKIGILSVRIKRKNEDYYDIVASNKNKADFELSNFYSFNKIIKKINEEK